MMKIQFFILLFLTSSILIQGQISIPYERYYHIEDLPKTNDKITFSLLHPFNEYPDSVLDIKSTYQYLVYLPMISDSLLNQYIKFTMLSLNFDQKYNGYKKGAEIWYGVTKTSIPTVSAIYYKNFNDSTHLYVFTGYSLTYFDKKSKDDLSKLIGQRIQTILNRDRNRNTNEHSP
jgi:hypothetical protein